MGPLDFLRGYGAALAVREVEAVAGIGHEDHVPAHVRAGPDRGRHAHVGGDAERDHMFRSEPLQTKIEIGANEGGIDALADKLLARPGLETRPESISRRARSKR